MREDTVHPTQAPPRTARGFFEALGPLSPLRVIAVTGPSVFESILELTGFGVADGWLNAITPAYHWHLRLDGLGHLRSRDEVHERSGRRVLYFELREEAGAEPFLRVYLHRERGEEFGEEREAAFRTLHDLYRHGATLEEES